MVMVFFFMDYRKHIYLFILLLVALTPSSPRAETTLTLAADSNIYNRYTQFLAEKKQHAEDVTDLKLPVANRPIAEIVLVQQALKAAGLPVTIQFIITPNAARDIAFVKDGTALMAGHTVFATDLSEDLYSTEAIIPINSFTKGIYTTPENNRLLQIKNLDELQQFRAISSTAWTADWMTLQEMDLANMYSAPTYESMIKMVAEGRGDFALLEFPPQKDLGLTLFGISLIPVPGLKVGIKNSRHFVVSKRHPDGRKIFMALEQGLQILKKQGRIDRYMREVGFYNQWVKDWKLINPTTQ